MNKVRIIIADSQKLIGEGIRSLFNDVEDLEVVGIAIGGKQLLSMLDETDADLVVMDVTMPELDGIDTMRELKRKYGDIKVVAYSNLSDIEYINSMRVEGAKAYVLKTEDERELIQAIRSVMDGHQYLSPGALSEVEKGYSHTFKHIKGEYIGLTEREREVIKLIALEKTNGEIAEQLFLSEDTVKTHRKNLMTKLNVRSAAGLVKYAVDRGWVS